MAKIWSQYGPNNWTLKIILPIKSYERIFGINVVPSLQLGAAMFPLIFSWIWGSSVLGVGSILSLVLETKFTWTPKNKEVTPNSWWSCRIRGWKNRKGSTLHPQIVKKDLLLFRKYVHRYLQGYFWDYNSHILNVLEKWHILVHVSKSVDFPIKLSKESFISLAGLEI